MNLAGRGVGFSQLVFDDWAAVQLAIAGRVQVWKLCYPEVHEPIERPIFKAFPAGPAQSFEPTISRPDFVRSSGTKTDIAASVEEGSLAGNSVSADMPFDVLGWRDQLATGPGVVCLHGTGKFDLCEAVVSGSLAAGFDLHGMRFGHPGAARIGA